MGPLASCICVHLGWLREQLIELAKTEPYYKPMAHCHMGGDLDSPCAQRVECTLGLCWVSHYPISPDSLRPSQQGRWYKLRGLLPPRGFAPAGKNILAPPNPQPPILRPPSQPIRHAKRKDWHDGTAI